MGINIEGNPEKEPYDSFMFSAIHRIHQAESSGQDDEGANFSGSGYLAFAALLAITLMVGNAVFSNSTPMAVLMCIVAGCLVIFLANTYVVNRANYRAYFGKLARRVLLKAFEEAKHARPLLPLHAMDYPPQVWHKLESLREKQAQADNAMQVAIENLPDTEVVDWMKRMPKQNDSLTTAWAFSFMHAYAGTGELGLWYDRRTSLLKERERLSHLVKVPSVA